MQRACCRLSLLYNTQTNKKQEAFNNFNTLASSCFFFFLTTTAAAALFNI